MKKSKNFSIQMKDQLKVIGLCLLLFVACKSKEPELNNPTAPTSQTAPSGADPGFSSVTATIAGPYTANGVDEIIVDVVMKDSFNRPLYEVKPQFNITNTDGKNIIDCTPSNLAGESRCRIRSTRAEVKTISLSYPFSKFIGTATFVHDPPAYLEIQTQPSANGVAGDSLTVQPVVQVFDEFGNPAFSATNNVTANFYLDENCTVLSTGATLPFPRTIAGDGSSSLYTFVNLENTLADTQYLGFTSPGLTPVCSHAINIVNNSVYKLAFDDLPPTTAIAGEIFTQFPRVSIRDEFGNLALVGGLDDAVVTLTPYRNSNCSNLHGTGLPGLAGVSPLTSDNGLSLQASGAITPAFELTMYRSGALHLRATAPGAAPICLSTNVVNVAANVPDQTQTDFTATTPTAANDFHPSTITATIRDQYRNLASGTRPTFSTSGTNNNQTACSTSNGSGVSNCLLRSTSVELKTITMLTPFNKVTTSKFINPPDVGQSSIVGTGPVTADNVRTSTITITMEDSAGDPVVGITPQFSASGTGNTYGACNTTGSPGVFDCTLSSTVAELKTLSTTLPFVMSDGTVLFQPGAVSGANSSITGTGPVVADDVATSTITIILRDQFNNIVPGVTPTFAATDTDATNTYGACSVGDVNGESTCTLRSQRAEVKTLQLRTPDTANGGNVTFEAGLADAGNSSITGTGPVAADDVKTSTITIILRDKFNNIVPGVTPTFAATDTGATNTYGACSVGDVNGESTCTLRSQRAEVKTLQLLTPDTANGGNVTFEPGLADAGKSSITGTSPVFANGIANSQIEITLIDQFMNPLVGEVPTFSANPDNNNYGACSAADATGVSQCTMSSNVAGLKDLQLTSPIIFTGGNVNFSSAALLVAHGTSASEDYGNVTVDTSRSYVVTNTATHSSGLLSVVFSPVDELYWGLVDDCTNDDLAQNDICSIQVNFLGDSAPPGAYTATLEVSSPDTGNITFNLQVVRDP